MSQDGGDTSNRSDSFYLDHVKQFILVNTVALSTECPRCCGQFVKNEMDEHKQSVVCSTMWKFYYCEVKNCQEFFFDRDEFFGHMEASHGYRYACYNYDLCGSSYIDLPSLNAHQMSTTAKCAILFSSSPNVPPTSAEPSPRKTSTTSTQPAATNMDYLPDNTLQSMSQDEGQTSNRTPAFSVDNDKQLIMVDTVLLQTECHVCCRRFHNEKERNIHVPCIDYNFQCSVEDCAMVYRSRYKLLRHVETVHKYRYACDNYKLCKRDFMHLKYVMEHQTISSTANRPNPCYRYSHFSLTSARSTSTQPAATSTHPAATSTQPATTSTQPAATSTQPTGESMSQDGGQTANIRRAFVIDNDNRFIMVDTDALKTECPRCCLQLGNKKALGEHTQIYACTVEKIPCNVKGCEDVILDRWNMLEHLRTSHNYRYACWNYNSCKRCYKNLKGLKEHQKKANKNPSDPCYRSPHTSAEPSPKKTKSTSTQLAATSTHPTATSTQPSTTSTQPAATNMDYLPDNTCESMPLDGGQTSNRTLAFSIDYDEQLIMIDTVALKVECPLCCGQLGDKKALAEHTRSYACRVYKFYCKVEGCGEVFFDRRSLLEHLITSHKYRYACCNYNRCSRTYKNLQYLKDHQTDPKKKHSNPCYRSPAASAEPSPEKAKSTSTQPAATSTQPTSTSTQPAATSTHPTATSTQPAATSTQPNSGGAASALQLLPTLMSSSPSSDEFSFSANNQKRAISTAGEPTLQCRECNGLFPTRQHLSEHECKQQLFMS